MADKALIATVRGDIVVLHETWRSGASRDALRHGSVQLRQLLVNGGNGLLQLAWRDAGLSGRPEVQANRLEAVLDIAPPGTVSVAAVGGDVLHYPAGPSDVPALKSVLSLVGLPGSDGAVSVPSLPPVPRHSFSLSEYSRSCVIHLDPRHHGRLGPPFRVRRRDVVEYVANKLGGAHYDPSRTRPGDAIFAQLDLHAGALGFHEGRDLVFGALLAVGWELLGSSAVDSFMTATG